MAQHCVRWSTRSTFRYGIPRYTRHRAFAAAALLAALVPAATRGQAPPTFSVGDAIVNEGQSGLTLVEFTVSLTNPNGSESSIGFTTNSGTATGGQLTRPFPSAGPIVLGDGPSSPYGVPIVVSGVTGPLVSLQLFVDNLTHPSPPDLDILLQGPGGESIIAQSDVGPTSIPIPISYFLRQYAPSLLDSFQDGAYAPTSRSPADAFPAPAPPGPHAEAPPEGTASFSDVFDGTDPIGTWRVFIVDDSPGGTGTLNRIVLSVGTPEPGTDFTQVFGRLTFPPGTTQRTVRVWVNGDPITEADETFALDLALPVNGVVGRNQGTGTIRNDDGGAGAPPTAVDDAYHTPVDTFLRVPPPGVLANDNSNGGGPMTAQFAAGPENGRVTFLADGSLGYYPNPGFLGVDRFTYRAVNAAGVSSVATVTLNVDRATAPFEPTYLRVDALIRNRARVRAQGRPFRAPEVPTGYEIAGGLQPGETLAVLPTGTPYPILTFDAPPGSYFIRMHSLLGTARSGPSNEVPLHVNTTVTPSAPANLLGLADGSALTLAWQNTFLGGVPTNSYLQVSGSLSLSVPLDVAETFSYPTVPPGTYTFAVVNANDGGASAPSNSVTLTFPGACSGPPDAPTDFLLHSRGNSLGALWDLPAGGAAPTGYVLDVTSQVFTGRLPIATREVQAQVPSGSYTVSVAAINACGASPPTPAQTVVVP